MSTSQSSGEGYAFGHDSEAIRRLLIQGELLNPLTRRLLEDAGITSGMRVLDVGCGPGDVSLIAAAMVGEDGDVLGVDDNPTALDVARARAQAAGLSNLTFAQTDIREAALTRTFDAIVGRLILQHIPERVSLLRLLAQRLRPGGLLAFQEYDVFNSGDQDFPPTLLRTRARTWCVDAMRLRGLEIRMGMKLYETFLSAGLPAPQLRYEAAIGAGPEWPGHEALANTVRVLLPVIVQFGLATAEEVEIETLADRLREETTSQGGVSRLPVLVSAWTRTGESAEVASDMTQVESLDEI